ncbi:MAG: hypothetical protein O3A36_01190 [bacterium]|nr:hypothetical protein [bacterium]
MIYEYFIAATVLFIPSVAGIAVLLKLNIFQEKITIISIGSILGLSVYGTFSYALAHIIPISSISALFTLAVFVAIAIAHTLKIDWKKINAKKTDAVALSILSASLILFLIIGGKLLIERPDGIYTGIINAYGDIGWHGAIITGVAGQASLPIENPIFAGEALTYPFLANLVSASMLVLGSSLTASVNVPAILLIPIILVLVYIFAKQYNGSKIAGVIACLLFLFGGATFGWIQFFQDIANTPVPILDFLLELPAEDYSGVGTSQKGFHFLNPVTTLLLPQRAMLFGIPLVLSVIILLHPKNMKKKHAAILAGVLAGMLPLFHAHACIALATAVIAMIITYPVKKLWVQFFIPALALGIPELMFYAKGSAASGSFFRFSPYWMAGDKNIILYWIQNTGAFIPISITGLFLHAPKPAKAIALAGTFLFILANTFLFAPWAWDNFKLFVFWFIFILPIVSWCFSTIIKKHHSAILRITVFALLYIHIFAGFLDVYKLAMPTARAWQEWDTEGIVIAKNIKALVPASIPILTAPGHNSPIVLAGRTIFLGYAAHIWSHGGLPWDREQDIKDYFAGTGNTVANMKPKYIFVGPQEHALVPGLIIRPTWELVTKYGNYALYREE